jgi:hypothetical protein
MFSTNVPKLFWREVVLTVAYLINRMPSSILKFQTPCHYLFKFFPYTKIIFSLDPKIFGCSVFVHIHQYNRGKLDPKSIKYIFLGYSPNQKGYKCYSPITKKVHTLIDATFFEHQPYFSKFDIQRENMREDQLWDIESDHLVQLGDTSQSFQTNPTNDHMVCFHYLNHIHKSTKVHMSLTQLEHRVNCGQERDVAPYHSQLHLLGKESGRAYASDFKLLSFIIASITTTICLRFIMTGWHALYHNMSWIRAVSVLNHSVTSVLL